MNDTKPIPKKDLMQKLRDERRAAGLMKVEFWVKKENVEKLRKLAETLV